MLVCVVKKKPMNGEYPPLHFFCLISVGHTISQLPTLLVFEVTHTNSQLPTLLVFEVTHTNSQWEKFSVGFFGSACLDDNARQGEYYEINLGRTNFQPT
jgi:hypothetical protein